MDLRLKKLYRIAFLSFISVLCGIFSCGFPILPYHLPPIFIIIALWVFLSSKNRRELILFITLYHSLSAYRLMLGYGSFFNTSSVIGIFLIFFVSILFSIFISFLSFNRYKFFQLLLINLLWCLPFLIVGWGNPIFAAGYFLPGMRWLGLIIFFFLVYLFFVFSWKSRFLFLCSVFFMTFIPIFHKNINITTVNTHFHNNFIFDINTVYKKIFSTFYLLSKKNNFNIALFPEDALPCFNEEVRKISLEKINQISTSFILAGATTCLKGIQKAGIILINKQKVNFVYIQRQPMPYVMYTPFSSSYISNWFNNGIVIINGKKIWNFCLF